MGGWLTRSDGPHLQFFAVAQVAGISKTGHDVLVLVEMGVNGGAPDGGSVFGKAALDGFNACWGGNHTGHVDVFGISCLFNEGTIGQFHTSSGGKHGIGNNQCLSFQSRCCHVFHVNTYFRLCGISVGAVGTDKGAFGMIEDVKKAFVERQTGSEDGGKDQLVGK